MKQEAAASITCTSTALTFVFVPRQPPGANSCPGALGTLSCDPAAPSAPLLALHREVMERLPEEQIKPR